MTDQDSKVSDCAINGLVEAISHHLVARRKITPQVDHVLDEISAATINKDFLEKYSVPSSRHQDMLEAAISNIKVQSLKNIQNALILAKDKLSWRRDDDYYYAENEDLGDGYKNTNLHSLLIGPSNAKYYRPDFILGVFLLGPFTFYRDHFHRAPELYINLSTRTGWRFSSGKWDDYPAGSIIFNDPNEIHATRVYGDPFVSVFCWTRDIESPCKIFKRGDWEIVERALQKEKSAVNASLSHPNPCNTPTI
jgi:hypothetical protein